MLINIENMPLVAMDFMNNTHKEDIEIINELYGLMLQFEKSPSQENETVLQELYTKWFEHTIEHFRVEEEMMLEKNFPPYPFHKSEHDKALATMDALFREFNQTKNINALKEYFEREMPEWLLHHIQSMDTVTAMFFKTGMSPCGSGNC